MLLKGLDLLYILRQFLVQTVRQHTLYPRHIFLINKLITALFIYQSSQIKHFISIKHVNSQNLIFEIIKN